MPEATIEIGTEDGGLDAFAACPEGSTRRPPVLLLAGRRGLRGKPQGSPYFCITALVTRMPPFSYRPEDRRTTLPQASNIRGRLPCS